MILAITTLLGALAGCGKKEASTETDSSTTASSDTASSTDNSSDNKTENTNTTANDKKDNATGTDKKDNTDKTSNTANSDNNSKASDIADTSSIKTEASTESQGQNNRVQDNTSSKSEKTKSDYDKMIITAKLSKEEQEAKDLVYANDGNFMASRTDSKFTAILTDNGRTANISKFTNNSFEDQPDEEVCSFLFIDKDNSDGSVTDICTYSSWYKN